jgi:outer membrane protein TolC
LEEAVASSQKSLGLANRLYANGLTDFLRVLDAERSLYQTQDLLEQSERAISTDLISLYKSLGGGWEIESQPTPADHSSGHASVGIDFENVSLAEK